MISLKLAQISVNAITNSYETNSVVKIKHAFYVPCILPVSLIIFRLITQIECYVYISESIYKNYDGLADQT
jgi:hypothetical protein